MFCRTTVRTTDPSTAKIAVVWVANSRWNTCGSAETTSLPRYGSGRWRSRSVPWSFPWVTSSGEPTNRRAYSVVMACPTKGNLPNGATLSADSLPIHAWARKEPFGCAQARLHGIRGGMALPAVFPPTPILPFTAAGHLQPDQTREGARTRARCYGASGERIEKENWLFSRIYGRTPVATLAAYLG